MNSCASSWVFTVEWTSKTWKVGDIMEIVCLRLKKKNIVSLFLQQQDSMCFLSPRPIFPKCVKMRSKLAPITRTKSGSHIRVFFCGRFHSFLFPIYQEKEKRHIDTCLRANKVASHSFEFGIRDSNLFFAPFFLGNEGEDGRKS